MSVNAGDRARLIALARGAVEAAVSGGPMPKVADARGLLRERRGCFVTLKNQGRLRGCIGTFQPPLALGKQIVEMGAAAARDPRFTADPITPAELPKLSVEVSVLSPLAETSHPEELEVGTHGIYIVHGTRAGCFLPEVAGETGWSAEEFLDHCCVSKAGLPAESWRKPDTKVFLFTSEKFEE